MSTDATTAPQPLTLRDLAFQAATHANLNSFSTAYPPDPDQATRLSDTLNKACPAITRLINMCDSGLVKQIGFFKTTSNELAVLSCPHPATHPTTKENLLAGSLGDALDIICPVTIGMQDIKGHVISVATSKAVAIETFHLPASASDPLSEEGPRQLTEPRPNKPAPTVSSSKLTIPVSRRASPCFQKSSLPRRLFHPPRASTTAPTSTGTTVTTSLHSKCGKLPCSTASTTSRTTLSTATILFSTTTTSRKPTSTPPTATFPPTSQPASPTSRQTTPLPDRNQVLFWKRSVLSSPTAAPPPLALLLATHHQPPP
ncbi:hypothetical protein MHU86_19202 [Fragilaria crotonensis]|nr:hypothetical protein MHU86_19202 [Fragilaria crotonensis]